MLLSTKRLPLCCKFVSMTKKHLVRCSLDGFQQQFVSLHSRLLPIAHVIILLLEHLIKTVLEAIQRWTQRDMVAEDLRIERKCNTCQSHEGHTFKIVQNMSTSKHEYMAEAMLAGRASV